MSILEREIEGKVVTWARKHGFLTTKVKFVEVGYPDRLFISPFGHTIFIEFKVLGGKPDRIQAHRISELRTRHIPAFCCDTELDALNILKAALEPPSLPGESDPADVVPIRSGPLSRPRPREILRGTSFVKTTPSEGISPPGIDRSPVKSDDEDLAGRDQQVGGFSTPNVDDLTRREEIVSGSGEGGHTPDKSGGD